MTYLRKSSNKRVFGLHDHYLRKTYLELNKLGKVSTCIFYCSLNESFINIINIQNDSTLNGNLRHEIIQMKMAYHGMEY